MLVYKGSLELTHLLLRMQTELSWLYLFNPMTRPSEPDEDTEGVPASIPAASVEVDRSCRGCGGGCRCVGVAGLRERRA